MRASSLSRYLSSCCPPRKLGGLLGARHVASAHHGCSPASAASVPSSSVAASTMTTMLAPGAQRRFCAATAAFDPAAFRATRIPELVAAHGEHHPAVAAAYARLAEHAWLEGSDAAEAITIQQRDVIDRLDGAIAASSDADLVESAENQLREACMTQAQRLLACGQQDAALALIDAKVLPLTTKKHGAAHQETLSVAYLAAQNQASSGKFDAARETIEKSILAQKQVMQATGKLKGADKSVQLLFLLAAELLAEIDLSTDNERRALELLGTGVIPGYRYLFGNKGPNEHVLRASKMLAVAHCTLGNPSDGLKLFETGVLEQEIALTGENSADVADTRFKMAQCMMYLGRHEEAVEALKKAVLACSVSKGAADPATLSIQMTLVSALFAVDTAKSVAEAEEVFTKQAQPALVAAHGTTGTATLEAHIQFARDLSKRDAAKAMGLLSGEITEAVKALDATHPVAIECHLRRAELLAGPLAKPNAALDILGSSVLPQQVAAFGKQSPAVFDSVLLCARCMFLCGENDSALQLLETEGKGLAKAVFGAEKPTLASAQASLLSAMVMDASGKAGPAAQAVMADVIPVVKAEAVAAGKAVPPRLAELQASLKAIAAGEGGVSVALCSIVKTSL